MRWPIRNQIMYPLLAVALASLAAVGAVNMVLTERRTSQRVEQQIRGVVDVLMTSSFPLTSSVLRQMRDLSGAEFVWVDATSASAVSTLPGLKTLPYHAAVTRIEDVTLGPSVSVSGRSYFHTVVEFPATLATRRGGVLHVLFPQNDYRRAWWQAFIPPFVVGAATFVVVAAVAHYLASRIGRTTARLREEVLRLARGDFRAMQLPALNDEIRDLSLAVNRTAEMLADYEHQVRRSEQMRTLSLLGASVVHQVRNAATGCRMAIDLHRDACGAKDHGESLDVAQRQLRLMESQLQRFLRIGKEPCCAAKQELVLNDFIKNLLQLVRPAADHARVRLDCRLPADKLLLCADEAALEQALLNLLLNAVEAAQQHGIRSQLDRSVNIEVNPSSEHAVKIRICDSGAGPVASVAASLFEPFVSDKPQGAGLGLAMAKEVINSHGGSIDWKRVDDMTQFEISLPLANNELAGVANSHS
jgi:signal transduction histidine kinase